MYQINSNNFRTMDLSNIMLCLWRWSYESGIINIYILILLKDVCIFFMTENGMESSQTFILKPMISSGTSFIFKSHGMFVLFLLFPFYSSFPIYSPFLFYSSFLMIYLHLQSCTHRLFTLIKIDIK